MTASVVAVRRQRHHGVQLAGSDDAGRPALHGPFRVSLAGRTSPFGAMAVALRRSPMAGAGVSGEAVS